MTDSTSVFTYRMYLISKRTYSFQYQTIQKKNNYKSQEQPPGKNDEDYLNSSIYTLKLDIKGLGNMENKRIISIDIADKGIS